RGTGIAYSIAEGHQEWAGPIELRSTGSLVADRAGTATPFALMNLENRGTFFVRPTEEVYEGMIVGENNRPDDMDVNITKEKKLTNMRSASADTFETLTPARTLTLEESLEFAREDECVEVTPESIRIRKAILSRRDRVKAPRRSARASRGVVGGACIRRRSGCATRWRPAQGCEDVGVTSDSSVLAVVAHPDNETLTAGGLLAVLARRCPVHLGTSY